jgi:hypothetical protein
VVREDRPRADLAAALVDALRRRGIRTEYPSGWEDYDARLSLSPFADGELQTSSHPEGFVQVRVRFRPRRGILAATAATAVVALVINLALAAIPIMLVVGVAHSAVRARRLPSQILRAEEE